MENDVIRAFPHALGPEKSILSTLLKDPFEFIGLAIEEGLTPLHFYQPNHATLFEFLLELYNAGTEIELVDLVQRLLDRGLLDRVGGPSAVTDLYTYSPSPGYFRHHLQHVKDKFVLRSILNVCATTQQAVYDSPEEVEALLDTTEAAIMGIREGRDSTKIESTKDAVNWVINDFQKRLEGKCEIQGLPTGFVDYDRMTGGLKGGEVHVVAARPSMGKTSFLMNMAEHLAIDEEIPGIIFSCEMTRRQLIQRLTYSRAKFDATLLSKGYQPTKGDLQRIQNAAITIARSDLIIDDTPGITIAQLRAKARRMKRERGIRFIGIDYLQLMKSFTKQALNSREREISEISAGVKGLAKELDLPIVILAQLNRGPEGRTGGTAKKAGVPRMSDLRESGAIEQDADVVGLLYRQAYYAESDEVKEATAGRSELIVAKNRNGGTGSIPLTFISALARFETGAPIAEPEPELPGSWVR